MLLLLLRLRLLLVLLLLLWLLLLLLLVAALAAAVNVFESVFLLLNFLGVHFLSYCTVVTVRYVSFF